MMSLQSATHSSQMKTRGPEISLRTSRRRFPQNEQWKSSIGFEYYIPPHVPPSTRRNVSGRPRGDDTRGTVEALDFFPVPSTGLLIVYRQNESLGGDVESDDCRIRTRFTCRGFE